MVLKREKTLVDCFVQSGQIDIFAQLGRGSYDTSPLCMNHASVSKSGQAVMQARLGDYLLFLTTSRMQFGLDVPGIRQVILVSCGE